jgi:alkylhydroperoxidase family enzyme
MPERLQGVSTYDAPTLEFLETVLHGNFDEIPNSISTLALRPEILRAAVTLWQAVMLVGVVEKPLKWMVGSIASKAHGCMYCAAHTVTGAGKSGVSAEKLNALWSFESSPLFAPSERVALRFAYLAAQAPNGLADTDFDSMKQHFSDAQIAEILAVVAVYGFYNRWNDSLATPLETVPAAVASARLGADGWNIGSHGRAA